MPSSSSKPCHITLCTAGRWQTVIMRLRPDATLRTHKTLPAGRSPKIGFEGGQTPLRQRVPKRGFRNPSALNYVPLNLTKLMKCVETKQLDTSQVCLR